MLVKKDNNINYIIGLSGDLNYFKNNLKFVKSPNKCLQIYKKDNDSYYYLFNANKSVGLNNLLDYYLAKEKIRNTDIVFDFLISKISIENLNKNIINWEKNLNIYLNTKQQLFKEFKLEEIKKIKEIEKSLSKDWVKFNPNLESKKEFINIPKDKLYTTLKLIPYNNHYSKYLVFTRELSRDFSQDNYSNLRFLQQGMVEYINAISINTYYYQLLNNSESEEIYFKKSIMNVIINPSTNYKLKLSLINNYKGIIKLFKKGVFLEYLSKTIED